jgi:putative NADH-flavin reductase
MKILVIGANGNIGQRVVAEATARGHDVTSAMRDPGKVADQARVPAVAADVDDPPSIASAAAGHDAVVSAVGPTGDDLEVLTRAARVLLAKLPEAGVSRVVVVGGAGSLEVGPGVRLLDTPQFPTGLKPLGLAHAEALEIYRREGGTLDWTYLSPPPFVGPGERTGRHRTGTDSLIADPSGGYMSMEDLAAAIADELEDPRFVRQRFTIGPPGPGERSDQAAEGDATG